MIFSDVMSIYAIDYHTNLVPKTRIGRVRKRLFEGLFTTGSLLSFVHTELVINRLLL